MKKTIFNSFILLCFLTSCEKVFLGTDEVNDPQNNFEILWTDFDEHYGLFKARNIDWDSVYTVYRPLVTNTTTDDELYDIFVSMLSLLDDSHTFIGINSDKYYTSGGENRDQIEAELSLDLLKQKYLGNLKEIAIEHDPDLPHFYGNIKNKNIGYINLQFVLADDNNFMDDILTDIDHYKAIILDLRNNNGGDDQIAAEIAGRFASSEQLIYTVEEKTGPNPNDFDEPIAYHSEKRGSQNYTKPVIVLTDNNTISGAEVLLIHLNSFDHVVQMGDTTSGDFSDASMRRFLPNGWQYQYSFQQFLLADGRSLDGLGHVPDVQIRNTENDINSGNDVVIEHAIDYLLSEYGIE